MNCRKACLMIAATFLAISSGAICAVEPASMLRCQAVSGVNLADDGSLEEGLPAAGVKFQFEEFVVDLTTGALHFGRTATQQWTVTRSGGGADDTILVPLGPGRPDIWSASSEFVRIRQWTDSTKATFLAFSLSSLVSGTCEAV